MKKIWMIVIGIFALILVGSVVYSYYNNKPALQENICVSDADCVKVQTGCCPCSMSGKEECVASINKNYYDNILGKCGKDVFCAAMYACQIESCGCVNGECVIKSEINLD